MSLKSKIEAIIYAAEEPVTVDQIIGVLKDVSPEELAPASEAAAAEAETSAEAVAPEGSTEAASSDSQSPDQETKPADPKALEKADRAAQRNRVREAIEALVAEYDTSDRGIEIRAIAGGYRMSTRPEHHDAVRSFAKGLKPPVRLSLQSLETLAVIAYKQPVTVPEISEIRGVDSQGVIGTLLDRKLVTTAGRKQVVGRPILYKTTKEFLLRFGLKDVSELPSMEEFEKLATDQGDLFTGADAPAPADSNAQTGPTQDEPQPSADAQGEPQAAEATTNSE